jgi:predicted AlkP superfamily pyrophosphatase or phosphodiesterase
MAGGSLPVAAAFPTSTAVSITSIGTGLHPGEHGIVGYTMAVPEAGAILQCLSWHEYGTGRDMLDLIVPEVLQPHPTLAERAVAAGIDFVLLSYALHDGSGLTRAANRGARFVAIPWEEDLDLRLRTLSSLFETDRPLVVSSYYAGLDTAGHAGGLESDGWHIQLRIVDDLCRRIAESLPPSSRLIVTADHGMVDLRSGDAGRIDIATRPGLASGLRGFAGDPRMRHLYTEPGETDRVADRWRTELADDVWIVERERAIAAGFFGPTVRPEVVGRIGDLLALSVADVGMFDSRVAPYELRLVGHHGSLTAQELIVPALVVTR